MQRLDTGIVETVHAKYVVGADGTSSVILYRT